MRWYVWHFPLSVPDGSTKRYFNIPPGVLVSSIALQRARACSSYQHFKARCCMLQPACPILHIRTKTIASGSSQVIACSPQRLELQLQPQASVKLQPAPLRGWNYNYGGGGGDNKVIWLLGPVTSRGKVSGSDNTSRANKKVSKNEPMHA